MSFHYSCLHRNFNDKRCVAVFGINLRKTPIFIQIAENKMAFVNLRPMLKTEQVIIMLKTDRVIIILLCLEKKHQQSNTFELVI